MEAKTDDANKAATSDGRRPTPTVFAASGGSHATALWVLVEAKADVNKARADDGTTPTSSFAAREGHAEALHGAG